MKKTGIKNIKALNTGFTIFVIIGTIIYITFMIKIINLDYAGYNEFLEKMEDFSMSLEYNIDNTTNVENESIVILEEEYGIAKILFMVMISFIYAVPTISIVRGIIEHAKATSTIAKNRRNIKKTNPYIFYRELPNPYGIGVNTILIDSTIENEKDIVATILDLCAKKYLHLEKHGDKYRIKVLKKDTSKLLENEQYILNNIINNTLNKLNYKEWFKLAVQDGANLKLFTKWKKKKNNPNKINAKRDKALNICKIVYVIICIIIAITGGIIRYNVVDGSILSSILVGVVLLIMFAVVLFFPAVIIPSIVIGMYYAYKRQEGVVYNLAIATDLKPTKLGIEELHKLQAFKEFIANFGEFSQKNPEEIVLWEYYLSYAQVFGLTNEILKTGYKKLVSNASFEIGDINEISIKKMKVAFINGYKILLSGTKFYKTKNNDEIQEE